MCVRKRTGLKEIQFNENGDLLCYVCNQYKPLNDFNAKARCHYRAQKDTRCRSCNKKQYKELRIKTEGDYLENLMKIRYRACRNRAKDFGWEFNIDIDYLNYLYDCQDGKCAISGIKMTYVMYLGKNNLNLSVDRIDSNKGYIKGNVQLVCSIVNTMKSDMSQEELMYFCKTIAKNNEDKK